MDNKENMKDDGAEDALLQAKSKKGTVSSKGGQNANEFGENTAGLTQAKAEEHDKNQKRGEQSNIEEGQPNGQGEAVVLPSTTADSDIKESDPSKSNNSTIARKNSQDNDGKSAETSINEGDFEEEQHTNGQRKSVNSAGQKYSTSPNSDKDSTPNLSEPTNGNNSTKMDTDGAKSGSKTVWGLRLDLLLLTIGVVIAAVRLRLPLGAQQVAIENPAIQKQLRDLENQFNIQFNEVKSKMEDLKSEVEAINEEMKKANNTVLEVRESSKTAEEKVDQTNANLKIVHQHLFNKDALTAAILILFFLIIGLMLYVLKLKSSVEPALAGGSTSRPLKGSREMEVNLQKMPSKPTLKTAVCIISFDSSNLDEYSGIIKETVSQIGGVSFRTHVIRKHKDIPKLPQCKLYIMCVEFTERHVIIEEQGLGLGDLKLTSYRGVRKLGGALVILYIHDPGSRRLTDDQLYSDGVYCVKKQQELKELCEMDRFISAHKNLNTAQKKALETAITDELNLQAAR